MHIPHPEERALARVSKDGRERLWLILRDAALCAAPQDEGEYVGWVEPFATYHLRNCN
jgi:hypothetical protein